MRLCQVLLVTSCLILSVWPCDISEMQNGCKIAGNTCTCGFGCSSEYKYRTRRVCLKALQGNTCFADDRPCLRGICIENRKGIVCMCLGTGFYGERCEKACPTTTTGIMGGMDFPPECIVI